MAALESFRKVEPLAEIDHQLNVIADRVAHGLDRRQIVAEAITSEPQLEAREAALADEFERFGRDRRRLLQPKSIAVVRFHWPDRAIEQHPEWKTAAFASASQAAMSSPEAAIIAKPSYPTKCSDLRAAA